MHHNDLRSNLRRRGGQTGNERAGAVLNGDLEKSEMGEGKAIIDGKETRTKGGGGIQRQIKTYVIKQPRERETGTAPSVVMSRAARKGFPPLLSLILSTGG